MNNSTEEVLGGIGEHGRTERFHIALLSAYAVGLNVIDTLIPAPIPWLRFGFTNIVTLTTLILYGLKAGMTVTLVRIFVSSFITGTFLGPSFMLSIAGGVSSTIIMWSAMCMLGGFISPLGLSLLGALTHNMAQLLMAYVLFIKRIEIIAFVGPIIILLGTVTGTVNGIVTTLVVNRLKKTVNTPAD